MDQLNGDLTVDVRSLTAGCYVLSVDDGVLVSRARFVKE